MQESTVRRSVRPTVSSLLKDGKGLSDFHKSSFWGNFFSLLFRVVVPVFGGKFHVTISLTKSNSKNQKDERDILCLIFLRIKVKYTEKCLILAYFKQGANKKRQTQEA